MCTTPTPDPGTPKLSTRIENVDTTLYNLKHLCELIGDVAAAAERDAQADLIKAESICVVFGWFSEELEAARDELNAINTAAIQAEQKEIRSC